MFADERFMVLFSDRGRPSVPPGRLALISVLQFTEGLTDRQAADAVRGRLDWKFLLGLELGDPGFDASVLSEFRGRLAESGSAEALLFEAVLGRLKAAGWAAPGGRQRTDSTVVLGAIRTLQRLELVGETLRAALEGIAATVPGWLLEWALKDWFTRHGPSVDAYRLPKTENERADLALVFGRDGIRVLTESLRDGAPEIVRALLAVRARRQVWVQQYHLDADGLHWRDGKEHGRPPSGTAIVSPYDLDARYCTKRGVGWTGKAQLTETCDEDGPRLITYVATVPATEADIDTTNRVHHSLARRDLSPAEHLVDSAYVTAEQVIDARDNHGIDLLGPVTHGLTRECVSRENEVHIRVGGSNQIAGGIVLMGGLTAGGGVYFGSHPAQRVPAVYDHFPSAVDALRQPSGSVGLLRDRVPDAASPQVSAARTVAVGLVERDAVRLLTGLPDVRQITAFTPPHTRGNDSTRRQSHDRPASS